MFDQLPHHNLCDEVLAKRGQVGVVAEEPVQRLQHDLFFVDHGFLFLFFIADDLHDK